MRLLYLLAAACSLVACSGGEKPLQFNLGIEAVQLDWQRAIDSTSVVILDNVMEGLTSYVDSLQGASAELLRPMPALAASWAVSEGGRVYRFHLRANVTWSDGAPLRAQQFVDSWERLLNPATGSANAYHLLEIENAAAYASGRERDFARVGVKAVDELTLEVRLRRPVPYFLHLVASASTFPVRRDLIEKYGDQWTDPENLVTLGPYQIADWQQGDRIVLQARNGYHGARPEISTVICRLIAEPLTAYALYENGELDILPRDLPPSLLRRLQSHPDYRSGPKLAVNYLLFNVHRAPLDRAENRRALIRALDRSVLTAFFEGSQAATATWIPPGLLGHDPAIGLEGPGAEGDDQLMRGRQLRVRFSGNDTWNLVFQNLQARLAEKLGLKVRLEQVDSKEFAKELALLTGPKRPAPETLPHVLSLGWVADYPDAHSFMNVFTSASENNYMGWKSRAFDDRVERAVGTADEGARRRDYAEAQKLLLADEAVLMPLFLNSHQALVRSSLRGVRLNVLDKWYFQSMRYEDAGWRAFGRGFLKRLRLRPSQGHTRS